MNILKLNNAVNEARRFIEKAQDAREIIALDSTATYSCKETGAARRASMDLTRALAELRKP